LFAPAWDSVRPVLYVVVSRSSVYFFSSRDVGPLRALAAPYPMHRVSL